ncbi:monovalent cation:proton antiporter family protein [Peribacillus acanthi]|uniref:monovalent cation:proton antiporter family protein n=1 Tax=Peribacillus acanthi TaxID=2171554 RepID=UPI000D3EC3E0|nr:monovalent cation:proton antiporter family protein [Peribacillus acanthi]
MDHHASVTSLVIVMTVAFLTPILMHRLKLNFIPVVVAEILMGLMIGKSGLNIVHDDVWLGTLSTLGFIFLMFLSGLEIDFTTFSRKNDKEKQSEGESQPNTFIVASIIFVGIFLLSLGLSYLFVYLKFIENAFLMTLIISTISLGVVLPTLKEAHLTKTNIGQIILLVAVIADLVTMILLAVFVSLYDKNGGNTWLLLVLFVAGVGLYFIGKKFKNGKFFEGMSKGTVQIGTRAVFALIIILVAVSETVGAENILGAFLAGVLVSLLSPNQEMVHKLDSFGYGFLIPIFFVMVGVNLDIWSLFSDPKLLLLIPILFFALLVSKLIPTLVLFKWFDKKTVIASGFLLTSTLSLVIAAATIGERMTIITPEMNGTLILVGILTSVITPIVFKKLFPQEDIKERKFKVAFVGTNQFTMPVSLELKSNLYEPTLYHVKQEKAELQTADTVFDIVEIEDYSLESLEKTTLLQSDIVVVSTGDDILNAKLAIAIKEKGIERVIVRIETSLYEEKLKEKEIEVFSVLMSTKILMRAIIESPSLMDILSNRETSLYEIKMMNDQYVGLSIRRFPFTGDVIFVRIFRGKDSLVPHGDTEMKMNDRLIVTGSKEYVDELKRELEFCERC